MNNTALSDHLNTKLWASRSFRTEYKIIHEETGSRKKGSIFLHEKFRLEGEQENGKDLNCMQKN